MGQVPAKYLTPSAPFGSSDAINSLNAAKPMQANPQQPLLPPGFTDPGTTVGGGAAAGSAGTGAAAGGSLSQQYGNLFGRGYFGGPMKSLF